MKEIDRAGKNERLIERIKEYSQLNSSYRERRNNDSLEYVINVRVSKVIYYRKSSEDLEYFYRRWVNSKEYFNVKDLKE